MTVALILYEDSRGENREFGPHELLMAMVADNTGDDYWRLRRRVESAPMNGIDKLLIAIQDLNRFRALAPGGVPVLAIVDDDKIRPRLGLTTTASPAAVEAAIKQRCDQPGRLSVVLLEENVESLVAAKARCDGSPVPPKGINTRDLSLMPVATKQEQRAVRDCIRKAMPSFETAVAFVSGLFR